jgi:hypothetical protein
LEGLAFNPERSSNSLRAPRIAWTEPEEPAAKYQKVIRKTKMIKLEQIAFSFSFSPKPIDQ